MYAPVVQFNFPSDGIKQCNVNRNWSCEWKLLCVEYSACRTMKCLACVPDWFSVYRWHQVCGFKNLPFSEPISTTVEKLRVWRSRDNGWAVSPSYLRRLEDSIGRIRPFPTNWQSKSHIKLSTNCWQQSGIVVVSIF